MADARPIAGRTGERLPARLRLKRTGVNRLRWIRKARIVRQYGAPVHEHLRYVLFDPELQNFTYEIANRDELASWLDELFGAGQYVAELDRRRRARRRRPRAGALAARQQAQHPVRPARRLVRDRPRPAARPGWSRPGRTTGSARPRSSRRSSRNGSGELISIDPQPGTGWLVPDELRDRWRPIRATSYDALPSVGQIDLFIHDSLHTPECERWELETAAGLGAGVLLSDNAHAADTARQFASDRGADFSVWRERVQATSIPEAGSASSCWSRPGRRAELGSPDPHSSDATAVRRRLVPSAASRM